MVTNRVRVALDTETREKLIPSTNIPCSRISRAASMESRPPEISATALRGVFIEPVISPLVTGTILAQSGCTGTPYLAPPALSKRRAADMRGRQHK